MIHDPVTFRHHRMSVTDYQMFAEIRLGRTLGDCFRHLVELQVLQDSDAERFYSWIVRLNRLGMVSLPIDTGQVLHRRAVEKGGAVRRATLAGILFYRLPLFSPDEFLRRTVKLVSPMFTRAAAGIWLLAMIASVIFISRHLHELADPFRYATAAQSALLMAILLVVLKGVHELGHAWACRHFGGPVPEMGVFFVVFTPCAYVDASASWSFPQRHRRITVALAGMYFESIAAMGALLLWGVSEPSLIKAAAHQALLLATVVTVGFNMNPLMKFDGYYVLTDLLGIPDLRGDALYEWKRCVKKVLYGLSTPSLACSKGGAFGLASFGCAVAVYKLTVILGISLLITGLPVVGLPMAAFFLLSFFWQALWKLVRYTVSSRELIGYRIRAAGVMAGMVACLFGATLHIPSPKMTAAYGVVRHEYQQTLHANCDGRLETALVESGQWVTRGQAVCRLSSVQLQADAQRLQAAAIESAFKVRSLTGQTPAEYAAAFAEYQQHESRLRETVRQCESLTVVSPVPGQVIDATLLKQPGTWVREGDSVAVIGHGRCIVEALISEEAAAGRLPRPGDEVEVRLEGAADRLLCGEVLDIGVAARTTVSEQALSSESGGPVEIHPETGESEDAWFTLRVLLREAPEVSVAEGGRAVVRLNVQRPPLGVAVFQSCCRLRDSFLMAK